MKVLQACWQMQKFLLAQRNMLTSCSILAKNKWSLSCAWKGVISHLGGAKVIVWDYMRHFCMRKREFLVFLTVATYEDGSPGEKKKNTWVLSFYRTKLQHLLNTRKTLKMISSGSEDKFTSQMFLCPKCLNSKCKKFLLSSWTFVILNAAVDWDSQT